MRQEFTAKSKCVKQDVVNVSSIPQAHITFAQTT
jgi:hypothetical protein